MALAAEQITAPGQGVAVKPLGLDDLGVMARPVVGFWRDAFRRYRKDYVAVVSAFIFLE